MSTKEDSTVENGGQNPSNDQNSKDQNIYDQRSSTTKFIRIITVMAYLISVSFVAIVLSAYYIFLWQPPRSEIIGAIQAQIGEPKVDYLMDSPINSDKKKGISVLINRINLTRKAKYRGEKIIDATTKIPINSTISTISTEIRRNESREYHETSTGVYDFINDKIQASFKSSSHFDAISTTPESLNDASELSSENISSMIGEGNNFYGNFTIEGENGGDETINGTDERGVVDFLLEHGEMANGTAEADEVSQEKATIKPNATEAMKKLELIYSPIYIDKDEENEANDELEASLEPMPSMSPTSTEELEDFSEETVDEPPDIEFDSENLPRR